MEFIPQKIKKLKYMAAKKKLYYVLNILYIFTHSGWIYCSCQKFQGCSLQNREKFFVIFVNLDLIIIQKKSIKLLIQKKIYDTYVSIKKDLKNCINFYPSIDEFWLYDFKFNWMDYNGTQHSCDLKNTHFY